MKRKIRSCIPVFPRKPYPNSDRNRRSLDLQIRWGSHPDLEIRGGGGRSQKKVFRLFGPYFGLKTGGCWPSGPPGPLLWIRYWFITAVFRPKRRKTHTLCGRIIFNNYSSSPNGLWVNRAFSHDVTAAILVFQNNRTAAMLVSQTNPVGIELFSYVKTFFCFNKLA